MAASVPVVAVAAYTIVGDIKQQTVVQPGEATQEQSVVESSCTETARGLPGLASQAKAAVGNNLWGVQPIRQQLMQPTSSFLNTKL